MNMPLLRAEQIWEILIEFIRNPYGVAGVICNLYAESGLNPKNLQNSYERRLEMSDDEYTKAVDEGRYKDFATDSAGYGLAQWTYRSRKQNLLAFAKAVGQSIGNMNMQCLFLCLELYNYSIVLAKLKNATSVREASDAFYYQYEKPSSSSSDDTSSADNRAAFGEEFYRAFGNIGPKQDLSGLEYRVLKRGSKGDDVAKLQRGLKNLGYTLDVDGGYGVLTERQVMQFQSDHGLAVDGKAGAFTQVIVSHLLEMQNDKYYTVRVKGLTETEAMDLKARYPDAEIIN